MTHTTGLPMIAVGTPDWGVAVNEAFTEANARLTRSGVLGPLPRVRSDEFEAFDGVVPNWVGQIYIQTTPYVVWIANGLTVADWVNVVTLVPAEAIVWSRRAFAAIPWTANVQQQNVSEETFVFTAQEFLLRIWTAGGGSVQGVSSTQRANDVLPTLLLLNDGNRSQRIILPPGNIYGSTGGVGGRVEAVIPPIASVNNIVLENLTGFAVTGAGAGGGKGTSHNDLNASPSTTGLAGSYYEFYCLLEEPISIIMILALALGGVGGAGLDGQDGRALLTYR